MEAKLIKTGNEYLLKDLKGEVLAITSGSKEGRMLSIKNCQAITNGYDLDELAMGYDLYEKINFVGQTRAYKVGFQKALEILGDKKFSEEQMKQALITMQVSHNVIRTTEDRQELIQSLQQTEWDVEIVMGDPIGIGDKYTPDTKPRLDGDGCLILKRK